MKAEAIFNQIQKKKSYLCVGLDTDIEKIPTHLKHEKDAIFRFNKAIVDNTQQSCVAYKINTAFYEALGPEGWQYLNKTTRYIKTNYPEIFLIADAKRGDIGNTSKMYAKAFFEQMPFDAITVAPYMGKDSVEPFLQFPDKWTIILGLTSNKGSSDFQMLHTTDRQKYLYEHVISTASSWGDQNNTMFVAGATQEKQIAAIRKLIPNHFLLVPGIGTQGGSLEKVSEYGMNNKCGLLVNSSRSIIFSDSSKDFAETARNKALELQQSMENQLVKHQLIRNK
jgi:orotidine-5'-phosphate decarboxylase